MKSFFTTFSLSSRRTRIAAAIIFVVVLAGGALYLSLFTDTQGVETPANSYTSFTTEVFSLIQEKHWSKPEEAVLAELYQKAAEKVTGKPWSLASKDKEGVARLTQTIADSLETPEEKEEATAQINDVVLANLQPFGRSRLYTTKKVQDLRDTVANRDTQANLYDTLGVEENASDEDIEQAYQEKQKELAASTAPDAEQQLQEIERAHDTLSQQESRQIYNQTQAEATIVGEELTSRINYIQIKQMSPISFEEFQRVAQNLDTGSADALILDLRDNIGGAIDILPYFLGPFIGPESYAYEFYSRGERIPFKTKTGWMNSLVRYKKMVVLINENTQSSGEVMAATLKKYNVGVVVGATTKGWGTVENTFPIDAELSPNEQYSLFLVHSVTLRDDGQPIEGRGVDPLISTQNPSWQSELLAYFNYQPLVEEVANLTR